MPYFFRYKIVRKRKRYSKSKSRAAYLTHKTKALEMVKDRIAHFNTVYQYNIRRITIKNQKTRWGSCSKKGNLNFNYRVSLLPAQFSDYVIVHELCHLQEFNHSPNFWKLVAKTLPQYKTIRKEFKKIRIV